MERLALCKSRVVRLGHPARLLSSIQQYALDAILASSDETKLVKDVRNDMDKTLVSGSRILNVVCSVNQTFCSISLLVCLVEDEEVKRSRRETEAERGHEVIATWTQRTRESSGHSYPTACWCGACYPHWGLWRWSFETSWKRALWCGHHWRVLTGEILPFCGCSNRL